MQVQQSWQRSAMLNTAPLKVQTKGRERFGTGFFIHYALPDGVVLFLLSNKHVLEDALSVVAKLHLRETPGKGLHIGIPGGNQVYVSLKNHRDVELEVKNRMFIHPSADLACLECSYLVRRNDTVLVPFSQARILDWSKSSLFPSQQVMFIGYPKKIMDMTHNLPVARTGTLASLPELDFDGRSEFLIDGTAWPGSSGSPVFVAGTGMPGEAPFSCIGVVHAHPIFERTIEDLKDSTKKISFNENPALTLATKSTQLLKLLESSVTSMRERTRTLNSPAATGGVG